MPLRFVVFLVGLVFLPAHAADRPSAAAIATAHPLATEAGFEILEAGGNAFDAAVAVSAALAVVEPYSSGVGGGGFWLLHEAEKDRQVMIDGRERAPQAAHRDTYLDAKGEVIPRLSMDGALAAGIPGVPAALDHLAREYGRLPLAVSLVPAIRLAREGFPVTPHYRRMAAFRLAAFAQDAESSRLFLQDGQPPELGLVIRQPELAGVLERMAKEGADGFYRGEVARRLVAGVRAAGGIWTDDDLAGYRVVEREPVRGRYRGHEIISAAPPSSGGVALVTMLNILAGFDLAALDEAGRIHLMVEAMRRAYRDRAEYLGDPEAVAIPLERLLHPFYADGLRMSIRTDRATQSASLPGAVPPGGGDDTTHFSILDADGNAVAATLSINYPFGAVFVPPGTGVLLNDEMDDFSLKPGVPNAYGLVGAEANAVAPGKRPLSSMTPTFVRNDERLAILGAPGGSRIITMVLLGVLEAVEGKSPVEWVSRPRIHHQYLPDVLQHEPGALDESTRKGLAARGHALREQQPWGNMQAVLWERADDGRVEAASDPRVEGMAAVRVVRGE